MKTVNVLDLIFFFPELDLRFMYFMFTVVEEKEKDLSDEPRPLVLSHLKKWTIFTIVLFFVTISHKQLNA